MTNAAAMRLAGRPEAVALIESQPQLKYGELRQRVEYMAAVWRSSSLKPGDTAVIALLDGLDSVTAMPGLIRLGGVPGLVSPRTDAALVPELLAEPGKLMLAEDGFAESCRANRATVIHTYRTTGIPEKCPEDPLRVTENVIY